MAADVLTESSRLTTVKTRGKNGRFIKPKHAERRLKCSQHLQNVRKVTVCKQTSNTTSQVHGDIVTSPAQPQDTNVSIRPTVSLAPGQNGSESDYSQSNGQERTYCDLNLEGRRLFEPGYVVNQLRAGCVDCHMELSLARLQCETRYGLGSILYINCDCGVLNTVYSSKHHCEKNGKRPIFDVNTKAATGMSLL